jgi:hypothetical protein
MSDGEPINGPNHAVSIENGEDGVLLDAPVLSSNADTQPQVGRRLFFAVVLLLSCFVAAIVTASSHRHEVLEHAHRVNYKALSTDQEDLPTEIRGSALESTLAVEKGYTGAGEQGELSAESSVLPAEGAGGGVALEGEQ